MRAPPDVAAVLIESDAFRVCRLMTTSEFVSYCTDRKLGVDAARLRQFERLGVFLPLLRVDLPEVLVKVEARNGGYVELGVLQPGEAWEGEVIKEVAAFDQTQEAARAFQSLGLLWAPSQRPLSIAHQDLDAAPDRHVALYSRFQIHALWKVVSVMTLTVQLEWAVLPDGTGSPNWGIAKPSQEVEYACKMVELFSSSGPSDDVALLCQLIANRYFCQTQGDERRITVTSRIGWDWEEYARHWSPEGVVKAFSIDSASLKSLFEMMDRAWGSTDPLSGWYNLARFISVDKRKRLTGDALRGLSLREMAHMLRLLHHAVFGETLPGLGESAGSILTRIPDVNPMNDPLLALELVANDFGVNPKPRLVLFVEGATELAVIPIVLERLFGASPAVLGIELCSLGGVGNAADGRENPLSALWRLIDYLHHHQTLAFVLMDNEGLASTNLRDGLTRAPSIHLPERMATNPDYVRLWQKSFEFDNFSDEEIATALNQLAPTGSFTSGEVAVLRPTGASNARVGTVRSLSDFFLQKAGHRLNKPDLGRFLVDGLFASQSGDTHVRPITVFIEKVAIAACRNHQPSTRSRWLENQHSGLVGTRKPPTRPPKSAAPATTKPAAAPRS